MLSSIVLTKEKGPFGPCLLALSSWKLPSMTRLTIGSITLARALAFVWLMKLLPVNGFA